MKVTVEDQSSVKKILHIEIPEETITKELDDAYKDLKKTAKVKGFRPGKTPRSVLERLYKNDVNTDVRSRLIQNAFIEAIHETKLNVVSAPKVDPPELQQKSTYQFDAEVEVQPEIDEIEYKNLTLKKPLYKPSEEEVEMELEMLRKKLAKADTIEDQRPVQDGDYVLIDYEGFKDGRPFKETQKTENFTMKVGDAYISDQFDHALIGMHPGEEKSISVAFPEDYFNQKLKGESVSFKVYLNEIQQLNLPPIDDEMAKKLGPFDSLDALKKQILKNISDGYERRTEQELNEQIYTQLLEKIDFEVPESLVEKELNHTVEDTKRSLEYANKSMEEEGLTREGLFEKYRDIAVSQVKRQLLLAKLIRQEKLELSDEEYENALLDMAVVYQQPVEHFKHYYQQNPDKIDVFKHALLEKKVIKLIMDSNRIEEVASEKEKIADDG
jgi:trigger factor